MMRGISLLLIALAMVFFAIVWLRNRATRGALAKSDDRQNALRSLLGQKDVAKSTKNIKSNIKHWFSARINAIHYVFFSDNPLASVKNILLPLVLVLIIEVVNHFYIQLPALPIFLVLTPATYLIWYKILVKKRKAIFTVDFTESLSSINGAISSGRTFLQAMDDYSKNNNNQLAKQFGIITRRLNFGDSPEVVFMDSWKVYPYREYYFFIVAILLNINSGGRLREVLNKLQRSLASSTAMEKKMLTMTSEMRTAAKITGLIPFAFLLLLKFISEENFNFIFQDERGRVLLYYLLGSVGFGIMVIKFLMRKL